MKARQSPPIPHEPGSSIDDRREEYVRAVLTEEQAGDDPIALFRRWYADACDAIASPRYAANVMTLATVSPDGAPSARIVLLKGFDEGGFVFLTDYRGPKGRDIERKPVAALVFHWMELERQVRIAGMVEKVSRRESEALFARRPRGSQLGAWASDQSKPVTRDALDSRFLELQEQYAGAEVPCPPHWGGYRVRPDRIEFWQGRPNRLHDRIAFERRETGTWTRKRLAP